MIPQFEPQYNREEIAKRVNEYILGNNFFSENKKTKEFEEKIAERLGVNHAITVTSGTMALVLALLAKGIKPGDRVLIPNITMMSTQSAVDLIGAKPIFIDLDVNNACMDIKKAKEYILAMDCQAVIYVTLNGRSAPSLEKDQFERFCHKLKIAFIDDNAQSFGSNYDDAMQISCPYKSIGCFSMSFHKSLSAGQGGFCVTNDPELATRLRELKNVGRVDGGADVHERFGINCKFTDIQAIIGMVGLKEIEYAITRKRVIYSIYRNQLENLEQVGFLETNLYHTTPWFMDVYVQDREGLTTYLKEKGIGTRNLYPELTSQKLNHGFLRPKHLKVSQQFASTGLWLPSSINLTLKQITVICDTIKEYYGN